MSHQSGSNTDYSYFLDVSRNSTFVGAYGRKISDSLIDLCLFSIPKSDHEKTEVVKGICQFSEEMNSVPFWPYGQGSSSRSREQAVSAATGRDTNSAKYFQIIHDSHVDHASKIVEILATKAISAINPMKEISRLIPLLSGQLRTRNYLFLFRLIKIPLISHLFSSSEEAAAHARTVWSKFVTLPDAPGLSHEEFWSSHFQLRDFEDKSEISFHGFNGQLNELLHIRVRQTELSELIPYTLMVPKELREKDALLYSLHKAIRALLASNNNEIEVEHLEVDVQESIYQKILGASSNVRLGFGKLVFSIAPTSYGRGYIFSIDIKFNATQKRLPIFIGEFGLYRSSIDKSLSRLEHRLTEAAPILVFFSFLLILFSIFLGSIFYVVGPIAEWIGLNIDRRLSWYIYGLMVVFGFAANFGRMTEKREIAPNEIIGLLFAHIAAPFLGMVLIFVPNWVWEYFDASQYTQRGSILILGMLGYLLMLFVLGSELNSKSK